MNCPNHDFSGGMLFDEEDQADPPENEHVVNTGDGNTEGKTRESLITYTTA